MKLLVSLISAVLVAADDKAQTVTCQSGFKLHHDGGEHKNETICRDINECIAGGCLGPAANFCDNIDGSFKCRCAPGFTLQSDGQTCLDDNECANNPCTAPFHTECTNTPGSYTCSCTGGYSFNATSGSCEDDDECSDTNICSKSVTNKDNQSCKNNGGSYSCDCASGYSRNADGICKDINECDTANICGRGTCVNEDGKYKCECSGFWKVDPNDGTKCVDVDECVAHTDNCHDPQNKAARRDNCVNIDEGWRCDCEKGYMENSEGKCVDIDECATGGDNCDKNAKCTNVVMRDGDHYFTCECNEGFSGNGTHCADIDECNPNKCGDGAKCTNLVGKYSCSCTAGWRDDPNNPNACVDIDQCAEKSFTCDEFGKSVCANTPGGYKCVCAQGYQGAGDACYDINECTANTHSCVSSNSQCHNTDGSHYCTCNTGYSGDATVSFGSCVDNNECKDDHSLCKDKDNMSCQNTAGSYECQCNAGWRPNDKGGCEDVNECWINNFSGCGGHNKGVCTNTVGSFTCACNPGYKMEADGTCKNFDECAAKIEPEICHLDAKCTDNDGSFTCSCPTGFLGDGKLCSDEDECTSTTNKHSCGKGKAVCKNTHGSHTCECAAGFKLNEAKNDCVDKNECAGEGVYSCGGKADNPLQGKCVNTVGSYECGCNPMTTETGGKCVDNNECLDNGAARTDICQGDNEKCENVLPSVNKAGFQCVCNVGFARNDKGACVDIDDCPAALKTDPKCANPNNAPNFGCRDLGVNSHVCECLPGYKQDKSVTTIKCDNIDECQAAYDCSQYKDPNRNACKDTEGSFECECNAGYSMGADGKCSNTDECFLKTHNCAAVGGKCEDLTPANKGDPGFKCSCQDGYDLDSKTMKCNDHNECTDGKSNACLGSNGAEMCFNKNMHEHGMKYECGCKTGYHRLAGASECTNKNECRGEGVHSCLEPNKSQCKDTDGSYTCVCSQGFHSVADGSCKDVNECDAMDPKHNCHADALCNNIDGSFQCACKPGYAGDGRICSDINECEMADNGCPLTNGNCTDTVGSYTCSCQNGYKHPPSGCSVHVYTESEIKSGDSKNPISCANDAMCTNKLFTTCKVENSICLPPSGTKAGDKVQTCTGTDTSKCVNIDECSDKDYAYDCNQGDANRNKCRDTVGGFECDCDSGYKFGAGGNCTDIDECASDKHPCHANAKCQNIEGQAEGVFTCVCDAGYKGNGTFCEDDNECGPDNAPTNVCGANAACTNSIGSYQCTCNMGYRAGKKGEAVCVDLDECDYTQGVFSCPENNSCQNTAGSYTCVCSTGYKACTADSLVHDPPKCANNTKAGDCTNVNECSDGNNGGCGSEKYNLCVDTPGSFYCDCGAGWTMQKDDKGVNKCVNINECKEKDNACPDPKSTCKDTEGSYNCPCSPGWKEDNQQCVDINECADPVYPYDCPNKLQSVCRNTVGGFECDCDVGTAWNTTTNGCTDLNECEKQDTKCGEFSQCVNMVLRDGTIIKDEKGNALYKCQCAPGYFGNGLLCSNKNECKNDDGTDTNVCGTGGVCTDNDGSYSCSCAANYMNNAANSGCVDRNECSGDGTYDCGSGADPNRGQCQNKADGYNCICNPGFTEAVVNGTTVCKDNNECDATNPKHTCDKNADCTNIDGSFTCKCKYGYSGSGQNGDCTDINECTTMGAAACPKANSECKNYEGRHDCPCVAGYKEQNGVCVDRDECTDGSNECSVNANCHNTVGSYKCTCFGEFEGDGKTCLMCPSDKCWTYDKASKSCKIKKDGKCTEVDCDATSMTVKFDGALFGLSDELATWASDAKPTYADVVNSTLDWSFSSALGANGMTYVMTADKKIKFKMLVALSGTARARSDFDLVVARQIDLGSKTLVTTPFGIGVMYTCSYPLSVDIQSSNFTAQVVSQQGQKDGMGSLAAGFEMKLNDLGAGSPFEFILGAILKIGVSWSMPATTASNLDSLSFWLDSCYVSHGSKNIYVVKNGCFANALEVKDLQGDTSRSAAFNYKLFKGVGENSATQSITCNAQVCDTAVTNSTLVGYCGKPTNSTSQCPKAGDDIYYDFKAGVGCIDGCV